MITYKRCEVSDIEKMYHAFNKGFSDYIIKFDLTLDRFKELFLKIEGNQLENSVMALDGLIPVGLMLGGIKVYEGVKTLRCGTLAVDPSYRNKGVAQNLFKLHHEIAVEHKCKQLFLEVIKGNEKAISFYLKQGYEISYDLNFYQHLSPKDIYAVKPNGIEIKMIDLETTKSFYLEHDRMHINWQNDFDYQSHLKDILYYGAFEGEKLIGVIAIQNTGKIYYISMIPNNRLMGISKYLIYEMVKLMDLKKLSISFTNNDKLKNFLLRLDFFKQPLAQYEMYLPI